MSDPSTYWLNNEPSRFEAHHIDLILEHCFRINASDITIQTDQPIITEIYGRIHKISKRKISNTEVTELLNALYGPNASTQIMSGTDVDTHYEIKPSRYERFRYRVNGTGCYVAGQNAIQITIRTIPATPPKLGELELPENIQDALSPQEGVVYVTGATGSGKSTLLASIIRHLAEQPESHRKILTYESPIEYVYDEIIMPNAVVSQTEIPRHLPNFAAGVRNALRRKPHAILVGESRDAETIVSLLEAALTGHPVYTTLHTNGVSETIRRLVGAFSQSEQYSRTIDILETMRLIIWQKLVPSVDGTRVALREYLAFNEDIRDQLLDCDALQLTSKIRQLLKTHGQPMIVDVDKKYDEGVISERSHQILSRGLKKINVPS